VGAIGDRIRRRTVWPKTVLCVGARAVPSGCRHTRRGRTPFIGAFACIFGLNTATSKGNLQLAVGLLFGLGLLLGLAVGRRDLAW
jgi:hypothetical protein